MLITKLNYYSSTGLVFNSVILVWWPGWAKLNSFLFTVQCFFHSSFQINIYTMDKSNLKVISQQMFRTPLNQCYFLPNWQSINDEKKMRYIRHQSLALSGKNHAYLVVHLQLFSTDKTAVYAAAL